MSIWKPIAWPRPRSFFLSSPNCGFCCPAFSAGLWLPDRRENVYAQAGIRINAVCPGPTLTAMVNQLIDGHADVEQLLLSHIPMNRMARPEEIARVVLFLRSDDASYITGHPLAVDGGWVARWAALTPGLRRGFEKRLMNAKRLCYTTSCLLVV